MESRKNVLGKLLMKEKELFLSTKYSIFGRNETLWFAKDLISRFPLISSFSQ